MASFTRMGSVTSSSKVVYWPFGKCDFLRRLTPEAMDNFESLASFHSRPAGTMLFSEDQKPEEVFILLRGEVRLSVASTDGRRFILRIAQPGEILGLASAYSGNSWAMTAETMYPCDIAQLRRADFLDFLGRYPPVLANAMRELSLYYEQACTRLRTMGVASLAAAKLARLLLEWSARDSPKERSCLIRTCLTHAEIGECIGTSRETVTRVLTSFQRRAIVEMRGSIMKIIDRPALEKCAGISEQPQSRAF